MIGVSYWDLLVKHVQNIYLQSWQPKKIDPNIIDHNINNIATTPIGMKAICKVTPYKTNIAINNATHSTLIIDTTEQQVKQDNFLSRQPSGDKSRLVPLAREW